MPKHCVVFDCKNDNRKDPVLHPEAAGVRYHALPKIKKIRLRWLNNARRPDLEFALDAKVRENEKFDVKYYTVCSRHFVDGYPSDEHPYPTLFSYNNYQHCPSLEFKDDLAADDSLMADYENSPADKDTPSDGYDIDCATTTTTDKNETNISLESNVNTSRDEKAEETLTKVADEEIQKLSTNASTSNNEETTQKADSAACRAQTLREQLALIPESPSRSKEPVNVRLRDLNPYITCGLCKGYLYEASTITECMHSFCKTCIVRHTERHLNCPSCDTPIHPTDPFVHIRNDSTIQDIVYRILPHIAEEEQRREKQFYEKHERETGVQITPKLTLPPPPPKTPPPRDPLTPFPPRPFMKQPQQGHKHRQKHLYKSHFVSLLLEYIGELEDYEDELTLSKRFVRVTGKATIGNLVAFIRRKLNLRRFHSVDIYLQQDIDSGEMLETMKTDSNLQSIKDEYYGGKDCIMELQYRISCE